MAKKDKDKKGKAHLQENEPVAEEIETAEAAEAQPARQGTAEKPSEDGQPSDQPESYTLSAEEFQKVQEHIQKLQKEKDETVSLLQRNQADFDNYRRRNQTVRHDAWEEGRREVVKELLPMLDNFQRAVDAGDKAGDAWAEGVKLVYRQLMETLAKLGVSEIDADGKFDPNFHNAVAQGTAEGKSSGDILEVYQKGFRMGDQILRHSMVKVAE